MYVLCKPTDFQAHRDAFIQKITLLFRLFPRQPSLTTCGHKLTYFCFRISKSWGHPLSINFIGPSTIDHRAIHYRSWGHPLSIMGSPTIDHGAIHYRSTSKSSRPSLHSSNHLHACTRDTDPLPQTVSNISCVSIAVFPS